MKLPRHQRATPDFGQTFERGSEETIAAMDRGGHDIPSQSPNTNLRLPRVGVSRQSIPVILADPFGVASSVQISCAVDAHLSVEPDRRGIHVSRIGDLLAQLSGQVYASLADYARQLNSRLRTTQESRSAAVSVEGVLTYFESVSGVKEKASLEHLDLFASAAFNQGRLSVSSGLGFSHITACPCVQETYRHSFSQSRPPFATAQLPKPMPLLTHTQRCRTRVSLSDLTAPIPLPELLACIDDVVVRNQNTLPREFELLNVYRAHAHPQFLEDALRDLLFAVYRLVRESSPEATILIKGESMESIHDFNMNGEIQFSVHELDRIFAATRNSKINVRPRIRSLPGGLNGSHASGNHAAQSCQKAGRKKPGSPSRK